MLGAIVYVYNNIIPYEMISKNETKKQTLGWLGSATILIIKKSLGMVRYYY